MTRFYILATLATAITMLAIDAVWLTTMAPRLYRPILGDLLREEPDFVAAALFYVIYVGGLVYFGVAAGRRQGRWQAAALAAAIFGFCAYATYDLTNQATLVAWSPLLTVVDLAWGTALSAVSATIGYLVAARLTPR